MISEWNEQHVSVMFAKKCFCENTAFKNMKCTRKGMLFVTRTNTLLQTLFGTRFPTVVGGSYFFVILIMAIIQGSSFSRIIDGHEVTNFSICINFSVYMILDEVVVV
jgi:hypothetical protein